LTSNLLEVSLRDVSKPPESFADKGFSLIGSPARTTERVVTGRSEDLMIRATKPLSIAGRVLAGATVAAAVLVPAATASAAGPDGAQHGSAKTTAVAEGYQEQWGPWYVKEDCVYWNGFAAGSGAYSYVSPCDRNPTTGAWWFITVRD